MRNLMILAAFLVGAGTLMGQMAEKMTATTPALAMASSQTMASAAPDTAGHGAPRFRRTLPDWLKTTADADK